MAIGHNRKFTIENSVKIYVKEEAQVYEEASKLPGECATLNCCNEHTAHASAVAELLRKRRRRIKSAEMVEIELD